MVRWDEAVPVLLTVDSELLFDDPLEDILLLPLELLLEPTELLLLELELELLFAEVVELPVELLVVIEVFVPSEVEEVLELEAFVPLEVVLLSFVPFVETLAVDVELLDELPLESD